MLPVKRRNRTGSSTGHYAAASVQRTAHVTRAERRAHRMSGSNTRKSGHWISRYRPRSRFFAAITDNCLTVRQHRVSLEREHELCRSRHSALFPGCSASERCRCGLLRRRRSAAYSPGGRPNARRKVSCSSPPANFSSAQSSSARAQIENAVHSGARKIPAGLTSNRRSRVSTSFNERPG